MGKPMHVCFFSGDITRSGGTENVGTAIANELVAKENLFRISFVSLFEKQARPFFAIDPRIDRHVLYQSPVHGIWRYMFTCVHLLHMVKSQDIDVLVDIDGILDMYALTVKCLTGVKVVSWEHFNYLMNPTVPYRKFTRLWAAHSADAIVTLTQADRALYQRHLRLRCPIVTIPNPLLAVAPGLAYDADSRIIISAGRLTHQKGFDLLVEAAAKVLPQHPDWRWLILGEGEDRSRLKQQITQSGLADQLMLQGQVADMDAYYRHAAFFVLTSRFEGLPMVLLEAKAHHLPIVSFDCPTGPSDIVIDGINGTLIANGDVAALAEAVETMIASRDQRISMSSRSLDNKERFMLNGIGRRWIELLLSLRDDCIPHDRNQEGRS